ncbi:DUF397 domain-containing protein [Streptomyces sp. NBC_01317]|uniref:DUF397 domain-containing protein n=1 Tax=Streptomyces sp. NBC_01317 TaxID=2903822 RepID=UPI002E145456|nr:DUF397 domain-containing protein [Streptomyces sp. NBC_01317]
MTTTADALIGADWFKSSYSNDQGGACLEGARLVGGAMAVRDSKLPNSPVFVLTGPAWATFVSALTDREFGA